MTMGRNEKGEGMGLQAGGMTERVRAELVWSERAGTRDSVGSGEHTPCVPASDRLPFLEHTMWFPSSIL